MKRNTILALLLTLPVVHGWCQQSPYSTSNMYEGIPTPQATTLGTFGDIPVSLYTGTVNVSVPIYKATVRDVTLDVSLVYDGSGLRMSQLPGPTGEGWHLSCGGVITRKTNGHPDEFIPNSQYRQAYGFLQPYFSSYSLLPDLVNSPTGNYQALRDTVFGRKYDLDPDVFYFNVMGLTGHFFLGNDGEWHVQSDSNVDVLLDTSDLNDTTYFDSPLFEHYPGDTGQIYLQPKVIDKIKLRDENGTVYEFGGKQNDAVEYGIGLFNMCSQQVLFSWNSTAWYLTKVTDRLGNVLYEFEYERGYYIAQPYKNAMWIENNESYSGGLLGYYDEVHSGNFDYPYGGTVSSPVYLKRVNCANGCRLDFTMVDSPLGPVQLWGTTDNGNIQYNMQNHAIGYLRDGNSPAFPFYYLQAENGAETQYQYRGMGTSAWMSLKVNNPLVSTRSRDLTSIEVITSYDSVSQTYAMHYDYSPRMHLTELTVTGSGGTSVPPTTPVSYKFRYDNYPGVTCNHLTDSVDHWGYLVGHTVTRPGPTVTQASADSYYSSRNPDPVAMKYGSLSRIIYPTGGMTVLEYEPHDFSRCSRADRLCLYDTTGIAGGLRIKSITLYDDTLSQAMLSRRTFTYKRQNTNVSSGELYSRPRYWWQDWQAMVGQNSSSEVTLSLFHTASILPLANSTGTHVGYTEVQETFQDGSKNRYTFSGLQDNNDKRFIRCFTDGPSPYDAYGERPYRRGRLTMLEQYDSIGALVRSEQTVWPDSAETACVLASNMFAHFGAGSETCYVAGGVYQMFSPKQGVTQRITRQYLDGSYISRSTSNQYSVSGLTMTAPYTHHAEVIVPTRRTDAVVYESEAVAWDYPFSASQELPDRVRKEFCLHPHKTSYYTNGTKVREDSVTYTNRQVNGSYHQLPSQVMERVGSSAPFARTIFSEYTGTGRPKVLKEYGKPDISLVWDFHDNYLLAQCIGVDPLTWPVSVGLNNFFNTSLLLSHLGSFRTANPSHLITTYTYNPMGGLLSITTPDNITTLYRYDNMFRLKSVMDSNNATVRTYDYDYRIH